MKTEQQNEEPKNVKYLSRLFSILNESIKTIVYNLQIALELSLPRNYPSGWRKIPIREVESRPMLCLEKSSINCL